MRKTSFILVLIFTIAAAHYEVAIGQLVQPNSALEKDQYERILWNNHRDLETNMKRLLLDEETAGEVKSVSIEAFNEDLTVVHTAKNSLYAMSTDAALIAIVSKVCSRDYLLRPLSPPGAGMGMGGNYVVGTLKIHTAERTVVISITEIGFCLEGVESADLRQRVFYSWALAKVLDDMVAEATGNRKRLSRALFRGLSGESVVDMNRRVYWNARGANSATPAAQMDLEAGSTPAGPGS